MLRFLLPGVGSEGAPVQTMDASEIEVKYRKSLRTRKLSTEKTSVACNLENYELSSPSDEEARSINMTRDCDISAAAVRSTNFRRQIKKYTRIPDQPMSLPSQDFIAAVGVQVWSPSSTSGAKMWRAIVVKAHDEGHVKVMWDLDKKRNARQPTLSEIVSTVSLVQRQTTISDLNMFCKDKRSAILHENRKRADAPDNFSVAIKNQQACVGKDIHQVEVTVQATSHAPQRQDNENAAEAIIGALTLCCGPFAAWSAYLIEGTPCTACSAQVLETEQRRIIQQLQLVCADTHDLEIRLLCIMGCWTFASTVEKGHWSTARCVPICRILQHRCFAMRRAVIEKLVERLKVVSLTSEKSEDSTAHTMISNFVKQSSISGDEASKIC